eukprot:scaffold238362_cov25-Attheya_sp.AAC.1
MAMTSRSNSGRETPNKKGRGDIHNARVTPGDTPPRQLNRVRQKKSGSPIPGSLKTPRRTTQTGNKKGRASEKIMSSNEESSNKENDEVEQNQGKNDYQDEYYGDSTNQLEQAASGRDGDDYARMITINDTLICRITALNRVVDEKSKIIASKEKLEKELYKQIDKQGDELRLERIEKKKLFNSTTIERTMGYAVANAFTVPRDQSIPWWQTYKQAAHTGIAQTRNGKITELKKAFISAKNFYNKRTCQHQLSRKCSLYIKNLHGIEMISNK